MDLKTTFNATLQVRSAPSANPAIEEFVYAPNGELISKESYRAISSHVYNFIRTAAQDLARDRARALARDPDSYSDGDGDRVGDRDSYIHDPNYAHRAWDICLQLRLVPEHPDQLGRISARARAERTKFALIVLDRMETEIEHRMMNHMCPPTIKVERSVLARQLDKIYEAREVFAEWDEEKELEIVQAVMKERVLMKEVECCGWTRRCMRIVRRWMGVLVSSVRG